MMKPRAELLREIEELKKDRDGWKKHYEMFANAWQREIGPRRRKTHLIDELVVATRELRARAEAVAVAAQNLRYSFPIEHSFDGPQMPQWLALFDALDRLGATGFVLPIPPEKKEKRQ